MAIFWNGPTIQRHAKRLRTPSGARVTKANHLVEAVPGLTLPTAYKAWDSAQMELKIDVPTLERLTLAFGLQTPWTLLEYRP